MYKWFAAKRILKGAFMYVLIIFILSALFNTVNDKTMRSSIEEQVRAESSRLKNMQPTAIEKFQEQRRSDLITLYRLDRPLIERIMFRTVNTITLNFGKSTIIKSARGDRDVLLIIGEALPRSLILFTVAAGIQILVGIVIGLKKAQHPGSLLDRATSFMTMFVYGMPTFWLAMIVILFFVYQLKLFPSGGLHTVPPPAGFMYYLDMLWHLALPLLTLLMIGFWGVSFVVRNVVLSILQEDYIMSARARGIPENKVLFGHTLRTAAPPLITISLLSLLGSISGAIIFEGIFSWPGLGNLYWIAVQQNDIPVLMGNLAISVGLYQAGLVALDLTYGFMDPRIKVGGKA